MAFQLGLPFHEGEEKMHALTKVPVRDNPMNPGLSFRAAQQIQQYPIMAVGATDPNDDDRPWTSIWGGEAPISQPIAQGGIIGIKTTVDSTFDPVINALLGKCVDGEVFKKPDGPGPMVSALSISLATRSRVKLYGRMAVGVLSVNEETQTEPMAEDKKFKESIESTTLGKAGNVQLVVKIEQSLGNCPKYLNKKTITAYPNLKPRLLSEDIALSQEAVDLIAKADMFFISSSNKYEDMDTNHRGGPPGFIRVQQPDETASTPSPTRATTLVWPEYSGNNLYQTLGNLITTPRAGVTIPDYTTGDVLYLSGDTKVLVNQEANELLPKSKLAVSFTVTRARLVADGLGFRGTPIDDGPTQGRSPYNPRIRYLSTERAAEITKSSSSSASGGATATLIQKERLTPTITRYRFSLSDPTVHGPWKPSQYVALDFSDELDMGYSHMRDDDPTSLNDDYVRTFTVASEPGRLGVHGEEFDIVARKVGNITGWLEWQNTAANLEVQVLGFGGGGLDMNSGDPSVTSTSSPPPQEQPQQTRKVFIAGGIGITPLLGQSFSSTSTATTRLKIHWTVNIKDAGLVRHVIQSLPTQIKTSTTMTVYITGKDEDVDEKWKKDLDFICDSGKRNETEGREGYVLEGVRIVRRRMGKDDIVGGVDGEDGQLKSLWLLCMAPTMREQVLGWLGPERKDRVVYENFDY